ncbi:MAG: OmpL47-type beta-barrel domain-containing protein, partial [Bacteroidota bacterium]
MLGKKRLITKLLCLALLCVGPLSITTQSEAPSPPAPGIEPLPPETYGTSCLFCWHVPVDDTGAPIPGVTGYTVQRSTDPDFVNVTTIDAGNNTSHNSTGLAYGSTYYWRVYARDANGNPQNMDPWDEITNPTGVRWSYITRTKCAIDPGPGGPGTPSLERITPPDPPNLCPIDGFYYLSSRNPAAQWSASAPVPVSFETVGGGEYFSIGLKADGTAWTWGINDNGQLGDGTTANSAVPLQVKGVGGSGYLTNVGAVYGGRRHALALMNDGTVFAWGNNSDGQLGNGTTVNSSTPVQVLGTGGSGFLSGVTAVCGAYVHSLALKADGTVWAWGKNNYGQLGDGTTISSTTPVQVKGPGGAGYLTNVVAIGQGAYHSLAVKADGTVWAWGNNQLNQLGDGTATHRYTPVQVKGPGGSGYLTNVSRVSGGNYHAVALKNDGTVWAWGYNNHGQLGNGTYTDSATPVQVKGALGVGYITNVNTIRGCFWGAAALKNDGTVWTWGYNTYGQLGNGTTADSTYPVKVKGPGGSGYITDAIALGGGYYHAAIVRQDRSPWAWGYNGYGQLGDGTATNRYYPTAVQYPETFSSGQIRARLSVVELRDAPGAFAEYPALEIESGDLSTQTNWNLPEGRYAMHVRAANNVNWSPWSAGALLAVDVTAPSLDLTEVTLMPDGALTAAATAGDNLSGVVKVVFAAKGETIEDTGAPYEAAWNTSSWNEGVYPVTAQAYDRAGNASAIAQQTITIDRTAPVTVHDYAHDGQWFNAPVVIQLTSTDNLSGVSATNYRIDGGETQTGTVFSFSAEGTHTVEYWAVDNAGNAEPVKTITIKLDMTAPTIETVVIPAPNGHGWHNVDPTVSFNAADGLSGLDTVTPETTVTTEGAAQNIAGMAVDLAGNSASTSVSINLDKTPPQIGNLQPADGSWINEPRPVISADLADAIAGIDIASATFILDGNQISENLTVLPDRIVYIPTADLAPGGHTFTVQATDQAGNSSAPAGATFHINPALPPLPPDPATVAPPLDRTSFTDLGAATSFLYTGANPIQTGVVPGTIEPRRAAVLRGKVLDCQGQPLPGVTVTIPDHPEFGQTVSRLDGMFDLAVNGGGPLTLRYQRDGYLTSQRQMEVAWQDYTLVSDVVLIQLDSQVTAVDLAAPGGQVARGSVVTDNDGTRQATLFFPEGVQALGLPGTLHVRATEYTVGENGPKAMPAELPPTSSYTYCVELSADEAMGTTVEFDRPLSFYVENFLDFPIGTRVPVGYYDYAKAAWIPSLDGRVIKVLGIDGGGLAELDVDGSGPATAQALAALGITEAERGKLAELYSPGQSIWRVQVAHFSPWDCNWPFGPPAGATGPQLAEGVAVAGCEDNSCLLTDKSTIEIQNQILRETIGIAGTPYTLNYASDRTSGRKAAYTVKIPVSEAQLPPGLKRIELEIRVAGKTYAETFAPLPNQTYTFTWDGKDAYGREMQGGHQAKVRIGYTYDAAYYSTQDGLANSFGTVSGLPITGSRARQEITLWEEYETPIGAWQTQAYSLGGWTLDVHHFYDPSGRVLYLGDGSRRSTKSISAIITTVAGMGMGGYAGDGVPATAAKLYYPSGVAIGPEGSIYITDQNRIRRVGPDGIIATIAGTGVGGYSGDGGPAREAKMTISHGVAIGPDGSIFISDTDNNRIRRVDPDGIITTIAGTGVAGYSGDGGPATAAMIDNPYGVAICPDGGIYISDYGNHRIRRVDPNGIITTIAGTGQQGYSGDAGPATEAMLSGPKGVAVGPDGSICIADSNNSRIRRVGPDGIITTIAGTGQQGYSGDGGPAIVAKLAWPVGVTFGPDGSIYIGDDFYWVRRISPDGIITTIAGTGVGGYSGDGGPATAAMLCRTRGVAVGPDGNLYIGDYSNGRIRRVSPALPGFTLGEYAIPSEDGSQIYRFDANGRHLDTKNVLTGTAVYTFRYNEEGVLQEIEDADGNLTVIERDLAGNPTAIIGPYGQRTSLVIDADGRLERVTNPASEIVDLGYVEGGLLNSLVDPRGGLHSFTYDAMGRLIRDEDPAGGVTSLEWEELTNGYLVRQREKTGESTEQFSTYQVENLRTGERRMTNQGCCGSPIVSVVSPNGTTTTTRPDGTIVTTIEGPDPRFGMQAPIAKSMTVTTPGGLTYTQTATRAVTLADPNNPLSVQTLTDTVTINGRTYTSTYDAAMRKITSTTPEGRQSFTTLDVKGRVVLVEVPGLAPVAFEYDTRGRLTTITEGTGIDARVSRINYNAQGFVESTTDPMERTT